MSRHINTQNWRCRSSPTPLQPTKPSGYVHFKLNQGSHPSLAQGGLSFFHTPPLVPPLTWARNFRETRTEQPQPLIWAVSLGKSEFLVHSFWAESNLCLPFLNTNQNHLKIGVLNHKNKKKLIETNNSTWFATKRWTVSKNQNDKIILFGSEKSNQNE